MNNKMNSKSKGRIFVSCSFSTFFLKPKNYILTGGPSPGPRPIPKMAERYDQRDRCTKRENHFSVCRKEGEQKCWNFQRKKKDGEVTTFAVPWALCWPNRTIYPIRHMRPLRLESRYLSPFWFSFSFIQKDFRVPLDPTGGKQKVWNWTSRPLASAFAAEQFVRLSWKQKKLL